MIGGKDVVIDVPEGVSLVHQLAIFRAIHTEWPESVTVVCADFDALSFLVFRDERCRVLVEQLGCETRTRGMALSLYFSERQITFVVDDDEGMARFERDLLSALVSSRALNVEAR